MDLYFTVAVKNYRDERAWKLEHKIVTKTLKENKEENANTVLLKMKPEKIKNKK